MTVAEMTGQLKNYRTIGYADFEPPQGFWPFVCKRNSPIEKTVFCLKDVEIVEVHVAPDGDIALSIKDAGSIFKNLRDKGNYPDLQTTDLTMWTEIPGKVRSCCQCCCCSKNTETQERVVQVLRDIQTEISDGKIEDLKGRIVDITGLAFFDLRHEDMSLKRCCPCLAKLFANPYESPNRAEIHPILGIAFHPSPSSSV